MNFYSTVVYFTIIYIIFLSNEFFLLDEESVLFFSFIIFLIVIFYNFSEQFKNLLNLSIESIRLNFLNVIKKEFESLEYLFDFYMGLCCKNFILEDSDNKFLINNDFIDISKNGFENSLLFLSYLDIYFSLNPKNLTFIYFDFKKNINIDQNFLFNKFLQFFVEFNFFFYMVKLVPSNLLKNYISNFWLNYIKFIIDTELNYLKNYYSALNFFYFKSCLQEYSKNNLES